MHGAFMLFSLRCLAFSPEWEQTCVAFPCAMHCQVIPSSLCLKIKEFLLNVFEEEVFAIIKSKENSCRAVVRIFCLVEYILDIKYPLVIPLSMC